MSFIEWCFAIAAIILMLRMIRLKELQLTKEGILKRGTKV